MSSSPQRPRVRTGGYLTAEASEGWARFCEENGCNVTALMEAIGRGLSNGTAAGKGLARFVPEARRIEAERLRRRK